MTDRDKMRIRNALAAIHRDIGVVIDMVGDPETIDVRILCDDLDMLKLHAREALTQADRTLSVKKAKP